LSKLESLESSIAEEVKVIAKKIALSGIAEKAPEKLVKQLDVLTTFGVHRQIEIWTSVEDFVGLLVARTTETDTVACLEMRLSKETLADDVMRSHAIVVVANNAASAVAKANELTP